MWMQNLLKIDNSAGQEWGGGLGSFPYFCQDDRGKTFELNQVFKMKSTQLKRTIQLN